MTSITIDGLNEEDFRREIEGDLRHGRDDAAAERLRSLLAPYASAGILPERFLSVTCADLSLRGWEYLGDCIARHDRPGRPVTAISIAFGWPGEELPEPDADGCLHPLVETGYFNDSAYPFSHSGRDDLLDGYSLHGCTWSADCEASDNALSLDGIDDLHGALARLELHLLNSEEPDPEEIRAGSLGACLLSVMLFQAVRQKIASDGLPRPLCVTAGSNGVYPYFDAPVAGMPEHVRKAAAEAEEEPADTGVPGPRYSSLLMTGIPRAQKRAVLVLAETESEMAVRIARLRGSDQDEAMPVIELPQPDLQPEEAPQREAALSGPAAGILMTKKPSAHNWDFRDMLGPLPEEPKRAPTPAPEIALPEVKPPATLPEREACPEPQIHSEAELDFAASQESAPALAPAPDVEPGFPLLADSLQDRLESLLAPHVPLSLAEPPKSPEPELLDEPQAPVVAQPWMPEQAGPVWPFGIDWLDENHAESEITPAPEPPAAVPQPSGLWARLRAWIRPRR